jgi:predicted NBD/HSP70 family sugar kinase
MVTPSPASAGASSPEVDLRGRRNRVTVLQEIRRSGPISRRGLHEKTAMRPNTVGEIVGELLEEGILEEVGAVTGRRGRRRQLVDLTSDGQVLGAEIFEGHVRVGRMNLRGDLSGFQEIEVRTHRRQALLQALTRGLDGLAREGKVLGLGVAVAGVVDSERGVSRTLAHVADWKDVPLGSNLGAKYDIPAAISNLTNVRLVALKQEGLIESGMSAALVVMEAGAIGCSLAVDGHSLRGAVEASSELGQTRLDLNGKRITLETLTDLKWIRSEVKRLGGLPPRSLAALFESNAKPCREVCDVMVDRLGVALANLVLLVKPSRLWLTGSVSSIGAPLVNPLRRSILRNLLPNFAEALTVEALDQGPEAGVRGAGGMILDHLFAMPEVRYF